MVGGWGAAVGLSVGYAVVGTEVDGLAVVGAEVDGLAVVGAGVDGAGVDGLAVDGAGVVGAGVVGAEVVGRGEGFACEFPLTIIEIATMATHKNFCFVIIAWSGMIVIAKF